MKSLRMKSLRIWIPLLPLLVVLGLWASLIGGWVGISAAVVGVVSAPISFRRNYVYVLLATAALWVLLIPMSVVAGRDRIALAGLLGVIGLAAWYVYGRVTFRRGLVRANIVSYFSRRQAGESHDDAMAGIIRTRYPEARWKQEAISDLYADSHKVSPSEAEDLAAVVVYMNAFETGRALDDEKLSEFQDEIRGSISENEARFKIPLTDHTL